MNEGVERKTSERLKGLLEAKPGWRFDILPFVKETKELERTNRRLREQVRVARAHLVKGMPASALASLEEQDPTSD